MKGIIGRVAALVAALFKRGKSEAAQAPQPAQPDERHERDPSLRPAWPGPIYGRFIRRTWGQRQRRKWARRVESNR